MFIDGHAYIKNMCIYICIYTRLAPSCGYSGSSSTSNTPFISRFRFIIYLKHAPSFGGSGSSYISNTIIDFKHAPSLCVSGPPCFLKTPTQLAIPVHHNYFLNTPLHLAVPVSSYINSEAHISRAIAPSGAWLNRKVLGAGTTSTSMVENPEY